MPSLAINSQLKQPASSPISCDKSGENSLTNRIKRFCNVSHMPKTFGVGVFGLTVGVGFSAVAVALGILSAPVIAIAITGAGVVGGTLLLGGKASKGHVKTIPSDLFKTTVYETLINPTLTYSKLPYNSVEEAGKAEKTLLDTENKKVIQNVCLKLMDKIRCLDHFDLNSLFARVKYHARDEDDPRYVNNKEVNNLFFELKYLSLCKDPDIIVHAMTILWFNVSLINDVFNHIDGVIIDDAYNGYIQKHAKSHVINKSTKNIKKGTLGDAEIKSDLLDNLNELFKLSSSYEKILFVPHEKPLLNNHRDGYLSGLSGMCNSFYNIYPLLGIEFESDEGRRLAEAMSSFVVAIGFHSFYECYASFNFTHNYFKFRKDKSFLENTEFKQ